MYYLFNSINWDSLWHACGPIEDTYCNSEDGRMEWWIIRIKIENKNLRIKIIREKIYLLLFQVMQYIKMHRRVPLRHLILSVIWCMIHLLCMVYNQKVLLYTSFLLIIWTWCPQNLLQCASWKMNDSHSQWVQYNFFNWFDWLLHVFIYLFLSVISLFYFFTPLKYISDVIGIGWHLKYRSAAL